jgi:thiosulfate dehydrogenase
MKKLVLLAVVILVASVAMLACAQEEKKAEEKIDPAAELMGSIERGKALFDDPELGTSGQTCNTCHAKGGTVDAMLGDKPLKAFDALNTQYPKYWAMATKVMTLDQVINWCIVMPLKGEPLAWDDSKLTDLAAYCASVTPMKEEEMKEKVMKEAPETE